MDYTWIYASKEYASEALVNAAVLDMKARLDNNPTDWVTIKEVTGNASDGWLVPPETLTDSEINNLDDTKHYNVAAVISGYNGMGLTAAEATVKINEHRIEYAVFMTVNSIFKTKVYAPSNVDMSGYIA